MNGQNAAPVFTWLKEQQGGFITNAIKCAWRICFVCIYMYMYVYVMNPEL